MPAAPTPRPRHGQRQGKGKAWVHDDVATIPRAACPMDLYLDAVGPALVLTSGGKLAVTPEGRRCIGRQFTCRYVWEPDPAATWRVGPFDPDAPVRIAERIA